MRPLIAALAAVVLSCPAQAAVIYQLTDETISNDNGTVPQLLDLTLVVTDAAVQSGTFALVGQPHNGASQANNPIVYGGNLSEFISLNVGIDQATPTYLYGSLSLAFTFNRTTEAITSSNITFLGEGSEARIGGSGFTVAGTYGLDISNCSSSGPGPECHVTAKWTVAEPSSFGILTMSLIGLCFFLPRRYG